MMERALDEFKSGLRFAAVWRQITELGKSQGGNKCPGSHLACSWQYLHFLLVLGRKTNRFSASGKSTSRKPPTIHNKLSTSSICRRPTDLPAFARQSARTANRALRF